MRELLLRLARSWSKHRQGVDPSSVTLRARRIYILPTRSGIIFTLVLLTMLLGSLNYGNNMGFALVFLLASIALISAFACQRNLAGLQVSLGTAPPAFAGKPLTCRVNLANPGRFTRYQICVEPDDHMARRADVEPGSMTSLPLIAETSRRGLHPTPPIEISTRFPLGLFRAWAWLHVEHRLLVYPAPAKDTLPAEPLDGGTANSLHERPTGAGEDFAGLRGYRPGESPALIAWKTLARTGELMARDLKGSSEVMWLDWNAIPLRETERRVAALARLALDCNAAGQQFGLRVPGDEIAPGQGPAHLHRCLRTLALLPGDPAPDPRQ